MNIHLNDPWFDLVQSGKKKYEGRRLTDKTKQMKIGDTLKVFHYTQKDTQPFELQITSLQVFDTFEQALTQLDINEVLPLENITIEQGVEIYKKYVSIETQLKDGVIMIGVRVLNT